MIKFPTRGNLSDFLDSNKYKNIFQISLENATLPQIFRINIIFSPKNLIFFFWKMGKLFPLLPAKYDPDWKSNNETKSGFKAKYVLQLKTKNEILKSKTKIKKN